MGLILDMWGVERFRGLMYDVEDMELQEEDLSTCRSWVHSWNMAYGLQAYPEGPRTQLVGYQGPNTIMFMVFGP